MATDPSSSAAFGPPAAELAKRMAEARAVWLVVDGNRITVSVFGNEAAAEKVVATMQDSHPYSNWRVERWAIR